MPQAHNKSKNSCRHRLTLWRPAFSASIMGNFSTLRHLLTFTQLRFKIVEFVDTKRNVNKFPKSEEYWKSRGVLQKCLNYKLISDPIQKRKSKTLNLPNFNINFAHRYSRFARNFFERLTHPPTHMLAF